MENPFVKYSSLIKKKRMIKKSNIQIIIPTYKPKKDTFACLESIYKQKEIKVDVLIIDNGGEVYKQLLEKFSQLNYVVLNKNTGSAGGFRIGGEIGIYYEYRYVAFSDDEVIFMNLTSLRDMKKVLDSSDKIGAVGPIHINEKVLNISKPIKVSGVVSICLFTKTSVIKKTGLNNLHLFWLGDDVEITSKIANHYDQYIIPTAKYFHPTYNAVRFGNIYTYFALRGLLYLALFAPQLRLNQRTHAFYYFLLKLGSSVMMSFIYFDITYIYTIILAIIGSFHLQWDFRKYILNNKYYLAPLNKKPKKSSLYLSSTSVLRKNKYYYCFLSYKNKHYLELRRSK
ncbi:MAG: glycosyltransferase family 2 protein [Candidatus Roizmanbacteria bacterium]|nr:MAG: glycosyltransferase family 2 protein [Candidatus Roizmanbacteria bacterium]